MTITELENKHTSNIVWTQEVIFRNIYVYTCTHMKAITVSEKEAIKLEEHWKCLWEGLKGRKRREKYHD